MIPLVGLLAGAAALAAVTVVTARPPASAVPAFAGYLERWAPLHGGYDPRRSAVLLGWLRLTFAVARPLARRGLRPDVVTLWGLWLAFAVYVAALAGGRWPLLAGIVLVASGLADTLDGCVAVLTERATRWGYVLDSLVDRASDVVYLFAMVAVGGRVDLALTAGLAFGFLEYLRARAGNAGMDRVEVATVGERATRVICCAVGLVVAGLFPDRAALATSLALGVLAVLSAAGVAQLLVAVRRYLVRVGG